MELPNSEGSFARSCCRSWQTFCQKTASNLRALWHLWIWQTQVRRFHPRRTFESCTVGLADRPVLRLEDGREIRCRVLVGAEGVGSKTASALGLSPPVYQGICAIRSARAIASLLLMHGFRGVSEFKDALPFPRESFCFYLGDGARAGMFQVEDLKAYWFITYLAPKVTSLNLHCDRKSDGSWHAGYKNCQCRGTVGRD